MRKTLTISIVTLFATSVYATENDFNVVMPTYGSIAPIMEQPQDYVPVKNQDFTSFSAQLLTQLGHKVTYPLQIIYKPSHKKDAVNLQRFLIRNGADYRRVKLIQKYTAIYPLYVRVVVHMKAQANCLIDNQLNNANKLQNTRPCYSTNNMHLQTAF